MVSGAVDDHLYFRQWLSGLDFAPEDHVALQMVNFVYAIGDRRTGEAVIVDPAYDVGGLLDLIEADGMRCVGVLATHYHPDHVGGELGGMAIEGIAALLERTQVPIHLQRDEVEWVSQVTGVTQELVGHDSADRVQVGGVSIELVHTPGHTPGSQCFLVEGRLVSGDTLFLNGCGRTDLPGSDPAAMYESLTTRLARVPDDTVLFPGHLYSQRPSDSMKQVRASNVALRPMTREQWLGAFS